jgi:AcrR family transcriptional regulator
MINTAQTRATPPGAAAAAAPVRQRLRRAEREQQIVDGATDFFARRGLDAQMRELAAELGIAHTLLYHYFPTKRQLIERVYEQTIAGRWDALGVLLDDPKRPVHDKLLAFYREYLRAILTPDWLRILVHSGLNDGLIPNRYFAMVREHAVPAAAARSAPRRGQPLARSHHAARRVRCC